MILKREAFRKDGIFSELLDDQGNQLFCTLEHAFRDEDGHYFPKIPDGVYECIRGQHRLEGMNENFETFEITGISGHTGLLFHIGNFNFDSDGCVLVGSQFNKQPTVWTVINSRIAFTNFMDLQKNCDKFSLLVTSA